MRQPSSGLNRVMCQLKGLDPMSIRPLSHRHGAAFRALARAAVLAVPVLVAGGAHAASATGTFTVSMPVNSPSCTVATSNSTVSLPTVSSPSQTISNYLAINAITTAAQLSGDVTSAALNQTATITCTTASTPILSFIVEPASGASVASSYTAVMYFVDAATTPNKAGAGNMNLKYEQVSVNGTAAAQSYAVSGNLTPYTTTFTTSAVANGTATVVWRPEFGNPTNTTAMGTPTGGSYNSPGQIVVNY
jgi:hypothetical protein